MYLQVPTKQRVSFKFINFAVCIAFVSFKVLEQLSTCQSQLSQCQFKIKLELQLKDSLNASLRIINRLQLHDAIYRPDSFVLMLHYCVNLKAIRYESTSLNRIVADKSHRVIVAIPFRIITS